MLTVLLIALPFPPFDAPACSVGDRPVIRRMAELPPGVSNQIGPMADPNQPFRSTDVVERGEEHLPGRRLICGYAAADGYVIEFEQGGRGYAVIRKKLAVN